LAIRGETLGRHFCEAECKKFPERQRNAIIDAGDMGGLMLEMLFKVIVPLFVQQSH
jgi:hypothetical protein